MCVSSKRTISPIVLEFCNNLQHPASFLDLETRLLNSSKVKVCTLSNIQKSHFINIWVIFDIVWLFLPLQNNLIENKTILDGIFGPIRLAKYSNIFELIFPFHNLSNLYNFQPIFVEKYRKYRLAITGQLYTVERRNPNIRISDSAKIRTFVGSVFSTFRFQTFAT